MKIGITLAFWKVRKLSCSRLAICRIGSFMRLSTLICGSTFWLAMGFHAISMEGDETWSQTTSINDSLKNIPHILDTKYKGIIGEEA